MMKEKVYLFNEKYAESNGWTRDDAAERQLASLPMILKVLVVVVLSIFVTAFVPDFYGSWIITGVLIYAWIPFTVHLVIKHLRGNDTSLNAEYSSFIEKEGALYYVRKIAPDWRTRSDDYMNSLQDSNFIELLNDAYEHQEKFNSNFGALEYDQHAEIVRLDDVEVLSCQDGVLTLKYKNWKRKWKKIQVGNGYIGLKEDIENGIYSKNTESMTSFPNITPKPHKVLKIFAVILVLYFLWMNVIPGISGDITKYYNTQKLEQVEAVEDLITEEMVLEVLNSKEELSFAYEESRVDINDDGGYSVYIIGHDENTGKRVIINFNEWDTGTGFAMQCTDEWNAYLWISRE